MATYILTSMYSDGFDQRTAETLHSVIRKRDRIACIASDFHAPEATDRFWNMFYAMFQRIGVEFSEAYVVDGRMTPAEARDTVRSADVVWLSGGDTPAEYKNLQEYGLVEILRRHEGVLIGMSAGTLNLARTVLCPVCNGYERQLIYEGLGCVDFTVFSHYDLGEVPREIKELSDIAEIYMMTDGSYILCAEGVREFYGHIVRVRHGEVQVVDPGARGDRSPGSVL